MALDISKLSGQNVEQLSFGLKVEEVQLEGEPFIDPAEAQRRSDTALLAFKALVQNERLAQEQYEDELKGYRKELAKRRKEEKPTNDLDEPEAPNARFAWADDFYFLLDHGWPWRVAVYIAWAGSPKMTRWPKTQEELATQILGLTSDRQIATWRKKNPAIDETIALMQAMPMMDYRRDIFEALAISASNPSSKGAQDRKTALTMTGDYVPHLKVDQKREPSDPMDMSDAELDEIIKRGGK
jgi:hypothetical protein